MRCECETCGVAAHRRVALRRCRCWHRGWRWRDWRAALRVVPRWPAPARYVGCRMRMRIGLAGYRVHGRGGRCYTPRCPDVSTRGLHGQEFERGAHVRARALTGGGVQVGMLIPPACMDAHIALSALHHFPFAQKRCGLSRHSGSCRETGRHLERLQALLQQRTFVLVAYS